MSMYLTSQVFSLRLDKTAAFILMALCDSAEDDGSRCFPSAFYIAWKTGTGKSTVYRTLEKLTEMGILEQVGMIGTTVEYQIHLEKAPLKNPWNRERKAKGRPRKNAPDGADMSQNGKNIPTVGNTFPAREKISQNGNNVSHSGKAALAVKRSGRPKKSDVAAGEGCADPYLNTQSYRPKYKDPVRPSPIFAENADGTPEAPDLPACEPITTISRAAEGTPPPLVAPPPSPTDRMVWRLVCTEMEAVMSLAQRREWLDRLELLSAGPDDYGILAPTPYAAQHVEQRWGGHFRAALRHATGHHEVKVEFLSLGVPA